MSQRRTTKEEYLSWIDIQRKATEIWAIGDLASALGLINEYLTGRPPPDLRRQAISFRGDLYEDLGNLEAARADFSTAHGLSDRSDYERYTLEISLGSVAETLGDMELADSWYLRALETASIDFTSSGGSAIRRLLELREKRGLTEKERQLVEKVVRQSWHLLRVEGEPDLQDLQSAAKKLIEAQRRPFSPDRPPAPKEF